MKKTPKIITFLAILVGVLFIVFILLLRSQSQPENIIPIIIDKSQSQETLLTEEDINKIEYEKELEWQQSLIREENKELYARYLKFYNDLPKEEKEKYSDFIEYYEEKVTLENIDERRMRNFWAMMTEEQKSKYKDFDDFMNSRVTLKDIMTEEEWRELNEVHIVGVDNPAPQNYAVAQIYSYKSKSSDVYSDYAIFDGNNYYQLYGFFVSTNDYKNYPVLVSQQGNTYNYEQENEKSFSITMYGLGVTKETVKTHLGVGDGERIADNIEKYYINSATYYIIDTPNGAFVLYTYDSGSYYNDFVCNRLKIAI